MVNMKTEKFGVTLPKDLIDRIKELAKQEERSVSNMTRVLLQRAIDKKAV
jgi:metal-responsive CopG/Arc/MetJ family transcriptional regulator